MLLLALTTDKLGLFTTTTADVDVHVSYIDINSSTGAWSGGGKQNTAISSVVGTPGTDILAVPGGTTLRNIKTINVRNKHATTSNTVTVAFNANGTLYELHKATLAAGEALEYVEGVGFFVLGAANPAIVTSLASDATTSVTLPAEVTGLTIAMGIGTWDFRYTLIYQSAVTTTGIRFSVNHTGTVTRFTYNIGFVDAAQTAATAAASQAGVNAAGQVYTAMSARAKSTAGTGTSISTDVANADMQMDIWGKAIVTVAGNIALYYGAEVAASSTLLAGSSLIMWKVG